MVSESPGRLTKEQVFNRQGCGGGTRHACHLIHEQSAEYFCLRLFNPEREYEVGNREGWRVNVDLSDRKVWCPLLVLRNAKRINEDGTIQYSGK